MSKNKYTRVLIVSGGKDLTSEQYTELVETLSENGEEIKLYKTRSRWPSFLAIEDDYNQCNADYIVFTNMQDRVLADMPASLYKKIYIWNGDKPQNAGSTESKWSQFTGTSFLTTYQTVYKVSQVR